MLLKVSVSHDNSIMDNIIIIIINATIASSWIKQTVNNIQQTTNTVTCATAQSIITGSTARSTTHQYLSYSEANYEVFLPSRDDTLH